jgi:outer membrane beta-barrel protein
VKQKFVLLALVLITSIAFGIPVHAEDVEVPEEELARETTLPVFSKRRVVLNRKIQQEKRLELGVGAGLEMNEPFYNDYVLNVMGTYNFSEISALNIQGLFWLDGLSSYGEQLRDSTCPPSGKFCPFDPSKAPHPKWSILGNYQFTAYYGKISLTKQTVMNLNLFGFAGLGWMNMGEVNTVAVNLGFGQNFFFGKNFGMRVDLRGLIYQGPDATSQRLYPQDNPSADSFDDTLHFNTQLSVSGVFIL